MLQSFPVDGIDFSDGAQRVLRRAANGDYAAFLDAMGTFITDCLDVDRAHRSKTISPESRTALECFLYGGTGFELSIEQPRLEVRLRRRAQRGFRVTKVSFRSGGVN